MLWLNQRGLDLRCVRLRPESELRKPVATSVGLGAEIGADHERLEKRRVPLTGGLIAAAGRLRSASLTGAFSTRSEERARILDRVRQIRTEIERGEQSDGGPP